MAKCKALTGSAVKGLKAGEVITDAFNSVTSDDWSSSQNE